MAAEALKLALERTAARPLLSSLVDAIGDRDHRLLDELESLVRARRLRDEMRRVVGRLKGSSDDG